MLWHTWHDQITSPIKILKAEERFTIFCGDSAALIINRIQWKPIWVQIRLTATAPPNVERTTKSFERWRSRWNVNIEGWSSCKTKCETSNLFLNLTKLRSLHTCCCKCNEETNAQIQKVLSWCDKWFSLRFKIWRKINYWIVSISCNRWCKCQTVPPVHPCVLIWVKQRDQKKNRSLKDVM